MLEGILEVLGVPIILRIAIQILFLFVISFPYVVESKARENSSLINEVRVSSIIDLETIEVNNGDVIKLYGVNADYYKKYLNDFKQGNLFETETGVTAGLSKAYFKGESLDHLVKRAGHFYERLLVGKKVYIEEVPETQSFIVYLDPEKQQSLNEMAVRSGFLVVSNEHQKITNILIEQEEARTSKAGLWGITVYVIDEGGWRESNFVYVAVGLLVFNTIMCILAYWYYIKSRGFLGMCAVYLTFLTTTFSIAGIYEWNEKRLFFWLPPVVVIILAFIGVAEFVLFTRSKSQRSLLYVTMEIVFFVLVVVVGFGSLYQGYSNNARSQTEISYSPPDYEYNHNTEIEIPHGNFIEIPENEYIKSELELINYIDLKQYNYHLSTINALYFSAATFFTVGYGDFSPKGVLKIISIIQMFIGYLSQVILFSLVVSKITSSGAQINNISQDKKVDHQEILIPSRKLRKKNEKSMSNKYFNFNTVIFVIIISENLYFLFKLSH